MPNKLIKGVYAAVLTPRGAEENVDVEAQGSQSGTVVSLFLPFETFPLATSTAADLKLEA